MSLEYLPDEKWRTYLDDLSSRMKGREIEIEVSGADIGDQIEVRGARFVDISHDRAEDELRVAMEGRVHVLSGPRQIAVDQEAGLVRGLAATDGEGRTHEFRFRRASGLLEG